MTDPNPKPKREWFAWGSDSHSCLIVFLVIIANVVMALLCSYCDE